MKSFGILLLSSFLCFSLQAQKVGVVLSGGGAAGSAHVGVLKALEENEIPIDYIVGTSVGALIGAFYASGYSPSQIEKLISTPEFRNSANGIIEEKDLYYIMRSDDNSSMLSLSFNIDSVLERNLPTNFVSSVPIDYGLMELFSPANAAAKGDFDSLMIPYRALATNITEQKQTILKEGNLSTAIRASMTYPFYISPISINGKIMFDGGIYNNFPIDIMCNEFYPDYIIASNVATKNLAPTEDNLIAQLRSILTKEANFDINCSEGIILNTDVADISTFDFYGTELALQRGYENNPIFHGFYQIYDFTSKVN
ncbi:MAG: patatin-like phospholipase family protein [Flavobacteriales bacterium]|nr:patatin-like phospholipase family protein [Flavobacteriales bacterium]